MIHPEAYDTVAWFLGKTGWIVVEPMLLSHMKKHKILGMGFFTHDRMYVRYFVDEYAARALAT